MKIVVVTKQGNAWVLEVNENGKNGGLNLSDNDEVVASFPYQE